MTVADIFRYSKVERLEAPGGQRGLRTGFRTGGVDPPVDRFQDGAVSTRG